MPAYDDGLFAPPAPVASSEERYELQAFDGARSVASAVDLELLFLKRSFRGRFLVTGQAWGILGRDVLNHVSLLLHGPGLVWLEHKDAPSLGVR